MNDTTTYRAFHSFWNDIKLNSPEMIIHYEHITSKNKVSAAIQSVLKFLNSVAPVENYMNTNNIEKIRWARDVIREPKYNHGTLVSRVCGTKVARLVHDATKKYSAKLGYEFDDDTGFWTLKDSSMYYT